MKRRDESHHGSPPESLSRFPWAHVETGTPWFRCHQNVHGPWFFTSAPPGGVGGRWDLEAPAGTCYLAESAESALREVVGPELSEIGVVSATFLEARTISTVNLAERRRVANLADPVATKFGATAELSGALPYTTTRMWSAALRDAGFEGMLYNLRFAPNTIGLGAFGPAGEREDAGPLLEQISARTVAELAGIQIVGPAAADQIDLIDP